MRESAIAAFVSKLLYPGFWDGQPNPNDAFRYGVQNIVAADFVNWLDSSDVAAILAPSSGVASFALIGIHNPLMRLTRCVGQAVGTSVYRYLRHSGLLDIQISLNRLRERPRSGLQTHLESFWGA